MFWAILKAFEHSTREFAHSNYNPLLLLFFMKCNIILMSLFILLFSFY